MFPERTYRPSCLGSSSPSRITPKFRNLLIFVSSYLLAVLPVFVVLPALVSPVFFLLFVAQSLLIVLLSVFLPVVILQSFVLDQETIRFYSPCAFCRASHSSSSFDLLCSLKKETCSFPPRQLIIAWIRFFPILTPGLVLPLLAFPSLVPVTCRCLQITTSAQSIAGIRSRPIDALENHQNNNCNSFHVTIHQFSAKNSKILSTQALLSLTLEV